MANNERTRAAAQAALDTYRAIPGFQTDEETAITDLIADLMHLADYKASEGRYWPAAGEDLANTARLNYFEEIEEAKR